MTEEKGIGVKALCHVEGLSVVVADAARVTQVHNIDDELTRPTWSLTRWLVSLLSSLQLLFDRTL